MLNLNDLILGQILMYRHGSEEDLFALAIKTNGESVHCFVPGLDEELWIDPKLLSLLPDGAIPIGREADQVRARAAETGVTIRPELDIRRLTSMGSQYVKGRGRLYFVRSPIAAQRRADAYLSQLGPVIIDGVAHDVIGLESNAMLAPIGLGEQIGLLVREAERTHADGFYWCSHETGVHLPAGGQYDKGWNVVQVINGEIYMAGADESITVQGLPDYVKLLGPLEPPSLDIARI